MPHGYPFRFLDVDHSSEGCDRVDFVLTAGSPWMQGGVLPPMLLFECMAQAAILISLGGAGAQEGSSGHGSIAGIDRAEFEPLTLERPVIAGDRLSVRTELVGDFGRLVRVRGTVERATDRVDDGLELMVTAQLTLARPE